MTDVVAKTVEINDAVFCDSHLKEVVCCNPLPCSTLSSFPDILVPVCVLVHRLQRRPAGGERWILRGM